MFKDISLYIDNKKAFFEYEIDKDKIIIKTIGELEIGKKLIIFYDENIYEIKLNSNTKFSKGKAGEIIINLDIKKLSFSVILKNNFFVKSVYKYINKLINKDILINEIKIFLNSRVGKKYKKDLNILLENIENKDKSLEELIVNNKNEYERIVDLTIHNKTYIDIAKTMSALELMLLITSYIFVPVTPKIDQDCFNDLVNVAKNYDNALENIWRLGMNYDSKGYNFDLLDNFFVDSKNLYYVGEYISNDINNDTMHIIYVSSKTNYAMELFKIHPYDFIIKPMDKEKVIKNVSKLLELDEQDNRFFVYEYNRIKSKIHYGDIVYFESDRKHIKIICSDGTEKMFVGKLKELIDKLPFSYAMAAQSFIINIRHVKICKKNSCIMDNGTCINIGRKYKDAFNIKMIEYNKHGGNG